jgi:hypothetical protein
LLTSYGEEDFLSNRRSDSIIGDADVDTSVGFHQPDNLEGAVREESVFPASAVELQKYYFITIISRVNSDIR